VSVLFLHPGSCRCLRMSGMHVCLNTSTLHHPTYSDKPDYISDSIFTCMLGGKGGGKRPCLGGSPGSPRCCWWPPPSLHSPGWCQRLPAPPLWASSAPHQGRAVTPTVLWRCAGSALSRPGMAAAAHTGSLPVHPSIPKACPGTPWTWCSNMAGSPDKFAPARLERAARRVP
jgi:hypothetical protein